jgi:hypothetical protein
MHFYTISLALLASTLPATFAAALASAEPTVTSNDNNNNNNNNNLARSDPAIGTALCSTPIANLYAYSSPNCTNN